MNQGIVRVVGISAVLVLFLSGCSIFPPNDDTVVFNGVTYTPVGGANVTVTSQGLVVSNPGSGVYGIRASRPRGVRAADFIALPIQLPNGGRWGLQAFRKVAGGLASGEEAAIATVWDTALNDSTHQIQYDFHPVLGATLMTLEYYLNGQLLYSVPNVPINATPPPEAGRSQLASGGESDGQPESVHVVRDGPKIVVATDYGGSTPSAKQGGCSGTMMRVNFPGIPSEFCTDYVQAVPQTTVQAPQIVGVEVSAEVLDEFTLTSATLIR